MVGIKHHQKNKKESFYNYLDEINRKPKINDLTLITQIKDELD